MRRVNSRERSSQPSPTGQPKLTRRQGSETLEDGQEASGAQGWLAGGTPKAHWNSGSGPVTPLPASGIKGSAGNDVSFGEGGRLTLQCSEMV